MSGNLWLRLPEDLHEIADTQFLIPHQVQESQPGVVPERLKELRDVEEFLPQSHVMIIYALTDVSRGYYIRSGRYIRREPMEQESVLESVRSRDAAVAEATFQRNTKA